MHAFDLGKARCYDPNEEARLRSVMRAVGEERFVKRVRSLGVKLLEKEMAAAGMVDSIRGVQPLANPVYPCSRKMSRTAPWTAETEKIDCAGRGWPVTHDRLSERRARVLVWMSKG